LFFLILSFLQGNTLYPMLGLSCFVYLLLVEEMEDMNFPAVFRYNFLWFPVCVSGSRFPLFFIRQYYYMAVFSLTCLIHCKLKSLGSNVKPFVKWNLRTFKCRMHVRCDQKPIKNLLQQICCKWLIANFCIHCYIQICAQPLAWQLTTMVCYSNKKFNL